MKNPDRKCLPEDLEEFGGYELVGNPSIAKLIIVLPEASQEVYRVQRRESLTQILEACGLPPMTWKQFFEKKL